MAVDFQPYFGQVVVQVPKEGEVGKDGIRAKRSTKGGLWLPQGQPGKSQHTTRGVIVAVGPQRQKQFEVSGDGQRCGVVPGTGVERLIKVGDDVIYKNYGCYEVELDEKQFVLVDETSILAVVVEKPDPVGQQELPFPAAEQATDPSGVEHVDLGVVQEIDVKDGTVTIVNAGVGPEPPQTASVPAGTSMESSPNS